MSLETDLGSIRVMLAATEMAIEVWPGGDPQEQVNLLKLRNDLYRILMTYRQKFDLL